MVTPINGVLVIISQGILQMTGLTIQNTEYIDQNPSCNFLKIHVNRSMCLTLISDVLKY